MSPPPPTSNTLSSQQRFVLVRTAKKLSKILGDVPRVLDDDIPPLPSPAPTALTRIRTLAAAVPRDTESTWRKRKPTHLPPLLKPSTPAIDAPSILSNAPSTASGSSFSASDSTQRRLRLEHIRRKLGNEVPATAVFPCPTTPHTPHTPKTSRGRTRSVAFSISSDESVHTVTFTAARVHSPRPHKTKHVYLTGPLPPVPPIPTHLVSASRRAANEDDDQDAGLIRSRVKMAAGSKMGGSDFKAARRAKREGKAQNRMAEPGELVEMVGFTPF